MNLHFVFYLKIIKTKKFYSSGDLVTTRTMDKKETKKDIYDRVTNNVELLNKFGNLVNRTLKFKELEEVPNGKLDEDIKKQIEKAYKDSWRKYRAIVWKNVGNSIF